MWFAYGEGLTVNAAYGCVVVLMRGVNLAQTAPCSAPAARPEIRPCRRGPGRSPSLLEVYLYGGVAPMPPTFFPVHHRTSVSPQNPCRTPSQDRSKIRTSSNSESPRHGGICEAFLESPRTTEICIMSAGRFENSPQGPKGVSGEKRFSLMRGHWVHGRPQNEKRTPNDADIC